MWRSLYFPIRKQTLQNIIFRSSQNLCLAPAPGSYLTGRISAATIMSAPSIPKTLLEHFNKAAESYEASTGGASRELADHVVSLIQGLKPLTPESKVLDNACGTGIVSDVVLKSTTVQPEVHAVDGAENMARIAAERFASYANFHAATMPGEELAFPDDTFSHSITNLGLMFFSDAEKGARQLARTLHPEGVAVVTGWAFLGHVKAMQAVQAQLRPDEAPFDMPIPKIWFDLEHTTSVLKGAGFSDVQASEHDVHLGGETAEATADLLMKSMGVMVFAAWSEEERAKAAEVLKEIVRAQGVPFIRSEGSGFGVKMRATVFVARKA